MKPIDIKNINVGDVNCDCFRACVCSILEISDEGVPNFVELGDNYLNILDEFLSSYNMISSSYKFNRDYMLSKPYNYFIVTGKSPNSDSTRAVIYKNGELVHDPHPDKLGIEDEQFFCMISNKSMFSFKIY